MGRYLLFRCLYAVAVLFGVVTIVFFLSRLSGDPAQLFLGPQATPEDVATFRASAGLDRPLPVQYGLFLAGAVHGDFGRSIRQGDPALQLVLQRLPASLALVGVATCIGLMLAVPAGILSAVHRGSAVDVSASVVALFGQSFPQFWLGLMLVLLLGVQLKLLPPSGFEGPQYLLMPGLTLGLGMAAVLARLLRSNLIDVLHQDYIRTGRAKGLREQRVLLRHALRNALLPTVTILGLQLVGLISGAAIVETVFGYPGMGRLALQAIGQRDYPIVQAFVFTIGVLQVLMTLMVDVLYTYLDPRVRLA
jgi:peptide/nickel transport system permease protein